jgi:RimJ/RimL family protein N-acetyltransferase
VSLPDVVTTERLSLALLTADEAADVAAGRHRPAWHRDFPRPDDRDAASMFRAGDPWGPRTVVRGRTVLGTIGFFGPPDPTGPPEQQVLEAEVGYGLVEEARGWGFATEALRGLLAGTDLLGVRVRASVLPANKPSIRVLAKCGFTELRGADEDGQLVMARPLPRS